jgi:hypothetical protein
MPHPRVPARIAAASLAIAVLSACSSSSSTDTGSTPTATPPPSTGQATGSALTPAAYRQALQRIAREENRAQHHVAQAFHARTVAQIRAALTLFAGDQRHAAHRLTAFTPPANAVAANSHLARAFNDNATAIATLLTKLANAKNVKNATAIIQSDQAAQQVGREIDTALAKLKRLGYTTGS